jgi:phospho-N-acetylmuramoyl-pentapeptide-transferase
MLIKTLCLSIIFFAVAVYAQGVWIRLMRGKNIGEAIKDYGPSGHRKKRGTPGMGGIVAYALAPFAALGIFWCGQATRGETVVIWSFPLMAGLVGLTDDLLKSVRGSSEGLRSLQKLFLQSVVCGLWTWLAVRKGIYLAPGILLPAAIGAPALLFISVCALNAVNVTDGLDGLAGGMVAISLLSVFMWSRSGAVPSAAALGAALAVAFLWHNSNPAGLFMGDVGSHFWGGLLISLCVAAKSLVYVIPMGFLFGVELLTSAIQIISIRGFDRRVFKMSPLHHHFELSGMSEPQIVARFMIAHAVGIAVIMIVIETIMRGVYGNA